MATELALQTRKIEGFLPDWAELVSMRTYMITTYCPGDTLVEHATFIVNKSVVEVLRYDRSDKGIMVRIGRGQFIEQMDAKDVKEYVKRFA